MARATVDDGSDASVRIEAPQASVEQMPTVESLIRRGRKQMNSKNYETALASFREAVTIEPENSVASCEAGWAAFHLGNLEAATPLLRSGIEHAKDDRRKGACMYNLGRVLEQRGKTDEAMDLYADSLKIRPNRTVAARHKKLAELRATKVDTAAAGDTDPAVCQDDSSFTTRKRFASRKEACKAFESLIDEDLWDEDPNEDCKPMGSEELRSRGTVHQLHRVSRAWTFGRVAQLVVAETNGRFELVGLTGWNSHTPEVSVTIKAVSTTTRDVDGDGHDELVFDVTNKEEDNETSKMRRYHSYTICTDVEGRVRCSQPLFDDPDLAAAATALRSCSSSIE